MLLWGIGVTCPIVDALFVNNLKPPPLGLYIFMNGVKLNTIKILHEIEITFLSIDYPLSRREYSKALESLDLDTFVQILKGRT